MWPSHRSSVHSRFGPVRSIYSASPPAGGALRLSRQHLIDHAGPVATLLRHGTHRHVSSTTPWRCSLARSSDAHLRLSVVDSDCGAGPATTSPPYTVAPRSHRTGNPICAHRARWIIQENPPAPGRASCPRAGRSATAASPRARSKSSSPRARRCPSSRGATDCWTRSICRENARRHRRRRCLPSLLTTRSGGVVSSKAAISLATARR